MTRTKAERFRIFFLQCVDRHAADTTRPSPRGTARAITRRHGRAHVAGPPSASAGSANQNIGRRLGFPRPAQVFSGPCRPQHRAFPPASPAGFVSRIRCTLDPGRNPGPAGLIQGAARVCAACGCLHLSRPSRQRSVVVEPILPPGVVHVQDAALEEEVAEEGLIGFRRVVVRRAQLHAVCHDAGCARQWPDGETPCPFIAGSM